MVVKLANKHIPVGFQPSEFRYVGRPASEQGDFGPEVGIADLTPVDEHGNRRGSRYFHVGVVEAQGQWFVYMESGPVALRRSWFGDSAQPTLEFMFTRCRDQQEAHRFFRRQCMNMNFVRIMQKQIGDQRVWVAKTNASGELENAWLVGPPLHRDRGLPQLEVKPVQLQRPIPPQRAIQPTPQLSVVRVANERPQPDPRAEALIRGLLHDARLAARQQPTLEVLERVGEELLPLVMRRIAELSAPSRSIRVGAMSARLDATWSAAAVS